MLLQIAYTEKERQTDTLPMTLLDFIQTAGRAIVTNALRSALTTLGIVIGVASVIVMGAVGAGARSEVDRQISSLGTQVLVVNPSARVYGGRSTGAGGNLLSEFDLAAIETKVPGVTAISGQLWAVCHEHRRSTR
jgi:putative ABC transport system permease protein